MPDPATVFEAVPEAVRDVALEPAGEVATAAVGPGEPARELPPLASSTSTAAKKPRAGKERWFVVEVAAGQEDDVEAEVVIMATYATKAGADRARGRLQVRARGDLSRDEVVAVRGEDQIHRYGAWDATLGRGVTNQGPPPR